MAILLKALCFILWMSIMLFMIKGSRRRTASTYNSVTLYIKDDEDLEMRIRRILRSLHKEDRLIIHDISGEHSLAHRLSIRNILRQNPSILYCSFENYGG